MRNQQHTFGRFVPAFVVTGSLLCLPSNAAAQHSEGVDCGKLDKELKLQTSNDARALSDEAEDARQNRRFAECIQKLEKAEKAQRNAGLEEKRAFSIVLAQCHRALGQLRSARARINRALFGATKENMSAGACKSALAESDALATDLRRLEIEVSEVRATAITLRVDGILVVPTKVGDSLWRAHAELDPGSHTIEIEAEGYLAARLPNTTTEKGPNRMMATLVVLRSTQPPPPPTRDLPPVATVELQPSLSLVYMTGAFLSGHANGSVHMRTDAEPPVKGTFCSETTCKYSGAVPFSYSSFGIGAEMLFSRRLPMHLLWVDMVGKAVVGGDGTYAVADVACSAGLRLVPGSGHWDVALRGSLVGIFGRFNFEDGGKLTFVHPEYYGVRPSGSATVDADDVAAGTEVALRGRIPVGSGRVVIAGGGAVYGVIPGGAGPAWRASLGIGYAWKP